MVDGIMYLTQRPNDVIALDAKTGRIFWIYKHRRSPGLQGVLRRQQSRPRDPRRHAVHGHARRASRRARCQEAAACSGTSKVAEYAHGYSDHAWRRSSSRTRSSSASAAASTASAASSRRTTRRPARKPGASTRFPRPASPAARPGPATPGRRGGGSIWVTGSYDPELNLTYWGIGNPGPDCNPAQRPGDNLYTDSVVALDADTGKLKWHFQFTPHDRYDWDSTQVPVLADTHVAGRAARS